MFPVLRLPIPVLRASLVLLATVRICAAADVGSGSPNEVIQGRFVNAFYRTGFSTLVSLPPIGDVRRFGPTGLIQEFRDAAGTPGVRLALIKPDIDAPVSALDVLQVWADIYSYYSSIGEGQAGYPTTDTLTNRLGDNPYTYQFFARNHALFVYDRPLLNGERFAVRDPFYVRWTAADGVNGLGPPIDIERNITSSAGTRAVSKALVNGTLYSITSGSHRGQLFLVGKPIIDVYLTNAGPAGPLGLPVTEDLPAPGGKRRQNFEGGVIEYTPGSDPVLRPPVGSVLVRAPAGGTLFLKLGETVELRAVVFSSNGLELIDRTVNWVTSNGGVAAIQASGATAVVRAVGGGSASITAESEGKTSAPIPILVTAPCCQIGEGAPSTPIQQAFLDAVARNRLALRLPAEGPVRRLGSGYVQEFVSADGSTRYLVAKSDQLATAYVVTGDLLRRYLELGGPAGSLGHPISDPTAGGRQVFENGALAGNPIRIVSGVILVKWGALGYETGAAGSPAGDAAPFLTFGATAGVSQPFRNGAIYGAAMGARGGPAYFISGLILARYLALGGAGGSLGMPASDEFVTGGVHRQNFEGGYIDYTAGDATAQEHLAERRPAVKAAPDVAVAGSRVRLAVSGFRDGSALRISVTGQPDFQVTAPNGAYIWESYVPLSSQGGAVVIRAAEPATGASAQGSYLIRSLAEARLQMIKVQGDGQTAPPGSQLPQSLRVVLRDDAGNPVIGAPVAFRASPGAQIAPLSAITNENGQAEAYLRLPLSESVVLATASASGVVTTFSAQSAASELVNFPKLMQSGDTRLGNGAATLSQKGSLLAAAASILRYHQARGELQAPNELADPVRLNQFLKNFCVADAQGTQICDGFLTNPDSQEQVVNLWRLAAFVGGNLDVSIEKPDLSSVRDFLAQGSPVLLSLALTADSIPPRIAGGHFVVAIGTTGDGGIRIHDPNPAFARGTLGEYLTWFAEGPRRWKAELSGAVRLLPRAPSPTGFLVAAFSPLELVSATGPCGRAVDFLDIVAAGPDPSSTGPGVSRFAYCDGTQTSYQLSLGAQPYRVAVTDFAVGGSTAKLAGSGPAAFQITRPAVQLAVAPQQLSFAATSVVNAATFTPGIAPGGLMAIFGLGLAGPGGATTAEFNGVPAPILSASPFQVNAQVPLELEPGVYALRVRSPFGTAEQQIEVRATAPAIFLLNARQPAIVNQDGTLNSPTNPARRGQVAIIYGTGFGAVNQQGELAVVRTPVGAVLNRTEFPADFAGLAPGFVGLYQINLTIPASMPPGIDLPLSFRQPGSDSNTVTISIQ